MDRIKLMLQDTRTWTTLLYMILMLPLGIFYFCVAVIGLALSLTFAGAPIYYLLDYNAVISIDISDFDIPALFIAGPWWMTLIYMVLGVLMLLALMHAAKGLGAMQGRIAKTLLVRSGND